MYNRNTVAVVDIETNTSHQNIWMAGVYLPATGTRIACFNKASLDDALVGITDVVGHNFIKFDLPVLERLWGWTWDVDNIIDTYVLGRLIDPNIDGGQTLRAWAERAGRAQKGEFKDFDGGLTPEMIEYCLDDVLCNFDVLEYQRKIFEELGFSLQSLRLESKVQLYTAEQERNGFAFNFDEGCRLYNRNVAELEAIKQQMQEVFPPIVEQRWSDKTGKRLKDKVHVFNVSSRPQIAQRLSEKGAVWKRKTPTGKPAVDEDTLADNSHIPEAALILDYLTTQKHNGMVKSWLDAVEDDGRIHGRVDTIGAITRRMSHSKPNLAQIPSIDEYRACFIADGKLVGIDASGLELRMLAHYMNDEDYTNLILNGDIHTYNQNAAGLPTRDNAKTFIYAFLYGAGDAKIGAITGGGAKEGAALKQRFLSSLPALGALIRKVAHIAANKGHLPALDGGRIHVRHAHAALNTLLQGAGAVVMKQALVLASENLKARGIPYKLVAQVHDEFQVECPAEWAEEVGKTFRQGIIDAGIHLDLRCPLDGEYKIGNNWSETH